MKNKKLRYDYPMKNKKIIFLLSLILLTSCSNDENIDEYPSETSSIIEDIKSLSESTFSKTKEVLGNIVGSKPVPKSDNKEEIRKNLESLAGKDEKARWVYDNFYELDDISAYLSGNDPDTVEFIYNTNNDIKDFPYNEGESEGINRSTPYYIQWDNRWAYDDLGSSNIGYAGCGPSSMAMVLGRIMDDTSITPKTVATDAQAYMVEEGVSWSFFPDQAATYNLTCEDIALDKDAMVAALENGPLIVSVGPGYFTLYGHIFVIDSYDNGKFLINDPNSIKNTLRKWSYDELEDQILHIWSIY